MWVVQENSNSQCVKMTFTLSQFLKDLMVFSIECELQVQIHCHANQKKKVQNTQVLTCSFERFCSLLF